MTKINRITIHGFKSFAHKTEVPFDNSYNCILGPNGSGKSNIGDALCFVLGRLSAKSMRAEKAANLIFNGGKKNAPASKAYVEIAFDNSNKRFPTKDKEVVVNRSVSKSGTSTYRVNGQKRTRSEVLDTLGIAKINPDGYNIILQGDITKFVDSSPNERRKILEEISDVSVYEEKKHKATLELNKVDDKLNNAHIILKERKTYLRELKKDRDQALQFKQVQDNIDAHKATLLHLQIKEKEEIKAHFDKQIGEQEGKVGSAESKILKLKEAAEKAKVKITTLNKTIEQQGEKEQVKVHKNIEDLKVKLAEEKTRISTLKDEINKIQLRKDQLQEEMRELGEKSSSMAQEGKKLHHQLQRKKSEHQQFEQKISQFRKKHKIESSQEIEQDIEVKDKLIEQKQEEVQVSRQKQQDLLREKDRLEYQLQTIDERMQKVHAVKKENKVQLQQLQKHKANFKHATIRLNTCLEKDSGFAAQVSHARKKLADFQEKHAQLNAKTMAMQANLAQNAAVGALKKQKGVHGTIAELGQVQKKYSNALETAAGARMQHLVVDSDKTAAACIKLLKEKNLGRASFIPLNKIKFREISAQDKQIKKQDGVHDFALKLISYPAKYQKAFSHVFGNTLIVDDINAARKVGIGRIKMATLDGNSAEVSGVMRGGSQGRRGRMGFKEKGALEELQAVESSIGQQESIINNIYDQRKANEEEISTLRTQRAELEGEIITLEKTLHLNTGDMEASTGLQKELQKQLSDVDQQLSGLQKQVGSLNKDLAGLKSKKQILRSQVSQLRNPRLLAQLSAFEEAKQQCRDQIVQFESDIKTTKVQVEQMFSPELQKMQEIMKQHQKEEQRFSKELQQLSSQVQKRGKDLEEKEKASKIFYSKYKGLFNEREKLTSEVNQAENSIEQLRDKTRGNEREINLVSLKNAEVKAKLAGLQEQYAPYKNVRILQGKNLPQLQQEVNKFEVILGQMSAVNMKALEVYEQIEGEYNKLVEKKSSLESEKTDVLTLMNEIETGKKTHFMKTFKHANNNFQRIFGGLFKKGKAHLELNNPKNPFEDGVSIKVKLTGRRYLDIKSLSGGEKTLTALSFIFAIQEYQPASFYILDEIDAALDKHNSGRLAELIRSYSGNAQYILISHNDALISEADTLFGISMRDGISKVTSLKI